MSARLADQEHRSRAVREFERNLCVSAGAGAGKTSVLVERILFAVLRHGIEAQRIVAITFTENAAAELRERLDASFRELQAGRRERGEARRTAERLEEDGVPFRQVEERSRAALEQPPTADTIHGHAAQILRRWAEHAGLPRNFEIDDGTHWQHHLRRRWPTVLAETLRDPSSPAAAWQRVLPWLRAEEIRAVVQVLAQHPRPERARDAATSDALAPVLASLAEALQEARDALDPDAAQRFLPKVDRVLQALQEARSGCRSLAGRLEQRTLEEIEKGIDLPAKLKSDPQASHCRELARRAQRILGDLLQVDEELAHDLLAVAVPLARRLGDEFATAGRVTFDGLLLRARDLLREDATVRRSEAERIALLLVDEFQDTDPLQCEIALLLGARPAPDAPLDPWAAPLAPGKLFLVGDPKQSIYRFRGADLEIYHRAVQKVLREGGAELHLTVSLRSPPEIVEPLNSLFQDFIGPRSATEPDYEPMQSARPTTGSGPHVEIWSVGAADAAQNMAQRRQEEGRSIAAQIQLWHDDGVPFRDVAVLLWSLNSLSAYLRPLREAGIPCVVEGGGTFVERVEVNEILSLLLAAADPEDSVAFLGALRSSLFAVPDPEIGAFAEPKAPFTWTRALTRRQPERVHAAARQLAGLHALLETEPADEVIGAMLQDTLLRPIQASSFEGAERLANLQKLVSLAQEKVAVLGLPLAEALREVIEVLESANGESESTVADEDVDAVRILTIHKAKGLEWPRVIVPDVCRMSHEPPDRRAELHLQDRGGELQPAVGVPGAGWMNLAMVAFRDRDREHRAAELKRLLYVAFTRARDRLVVVNHQPRPPASLPWLPALRSWGYAPDGSWESVPLRLARGQVVHRVLGSGSLPPRSTGTDPPGPEELLHAVERGRRLAARVAAAPPRILTPSGREAPRRGPPSGTASARNAPALGIACHRVLELDGPAGPFAPETIRTCAASVAAELAIDPGSLVTELEALLHAPAMERLRSWFAGVEVLAQELPLLLESAGGVFRGTVDLVYRRGEDLYVSDFKTDQVADEETLRTRYRQQLVLYGRALQRALGLPGMPRLELAHLRSGTRIAVDPRPLQQPLFGE